MDSLSLLLNALASGAAQGAADSVSEAVKSSYSKLEHLVSAKFSGNRSAKLALTEHATDPETWQAPLSKALTISGADVDRAIIEAAQQLMALLDHVGAAQGKYWVDMQGAQGVQIGDGNQQHNTSNTVALPEAGEYPVVVHQVGSVTATGNSQAVGINYGSVDRGESAR